jgi:hypothetical protein
MPSKRDIRIGRYTGKIAQGDAIQVMKKLPPNCINTVCTSPPYYSLRDYKVTTDVFGGSGSCKHDFVDGVCTCGAQLCTLGDEAEAYCQDGSCGKCYVCHIVAVFDEVKRVLREDGTAFLNIGDSFKYSAMGVPWAVAFALERNGWIIRSEIIWHKRNPMPSSVRAPFWEQHKVKVDNRGRGGEAWRDNATKTPQQRHAPDGSFLSDAVFEDCPGCEKCSPNDGMVIKNGSWRPTTAHEQVFMLTKSNKYYCDQEALIALWGLDGNPRSVIRLTGSTYSGAHFAVMNPELARWCVVAGCAARCCPTCGTPHLRVLEGNGVRRDRRSLVAQGVYRERMYTKLRKTVGWRPVCSCASEQTVPGIVLDPFAGSGTTGVEALKLGFRFIGIDINGGDCDLGDHTANMRLEAAKMRLSIEDYLAGKRPLPGLSD